MKCIISANDLVSISKLLAPNVDKEAVKEVILKVIAENDSNLNECLVVSRKLEAEIEMGFSGMKRLTKKVHTDMCQLLTSLGFGSKAPI